MFITYGMRSFTGSATFYGIHSGHQGYVLWFGIYNSQPWVSVLTMSHQSSYPQELGRSKIAEYVKNNICHIVDVAAGHSRIPMWLPVILEEREVDGEPVYWLDARVQLGGGGVVSAETN
jgi:hypothetical protein